MDLSLLRHGGRRVARRLFPFVLFVGTLVPLAGSAADDPEALDANPLRLPAPGMHQLRILNSNTLELLLITAKAPDPARPEAWDYVNAEGQLRLPNPSTFSVLVNGGKRRVAEGGFKRRVLYAPLRQRDLRLANSIYLRLAETLREGDEVSVPNPNLRDWPKQLHFHARFEPGRISPAIHVNQTGYQTRFPKRAMIGFYLGNLGELDVSPAGGFSLVTVAGGKVVFRGPLSPRRDEGYEYTPLPYQKVLEADFSAVTQPGEYRLSVPGLGVSLPFLIDDGIAAAFARTYALGLYHQRCGTNNALPYTRFVHGPCHTAPAALPTREFTNAAGFLAQSTMDYTNSRRHVARPLKTFEASLYPFSTRGRMDVSGGHHDAGDYSKYTLNSAALIHTLAFAADALPGVAALDNLGLPESGDGKSDVLQEAKWEADFLGRMQDADGGFFFLVYPRDRRYENNVLPDEGDPQIVWPKNTAATAASVAALAQIASSPTFKKQFPEAAAAALEKARKGWTFLERALAKHGPDGSYQKLTHYGDDFTHDDEIVWAACELFLATGENAFHKRVLTGFNPADPATRRWGWWRLYESYGRAIRSYAFAARSGRMPRAKLDARFLSLCENEVVSAANDQLRWATQSAYGTSFPTETKRFLSGGWYFSLDQAFDIAAGFALDHPPRNDPRPKYLEAMLSNLNYEAGNNPVNVSYLCGLGWRRPREIVHHFAMNDRRILPPTGIPVGNIQSGYMWLDLYQKELGTMTYPSDGAKNGPFPIYDRWADSFNVQTEFIAVNQARALAVTALLMAQTGLSNQVWRPIDATIELAAAGGTTAGTTARLKTGSNPGPGPARIVWEASGHEPAFGEVFTLKAGPRPTWIEVEAQWPDGRRAFVITNFHQAPQRSQPADR